jgi:uncharacterized protein (DUF427 family)
MAQATWNGAILAESNQYEIVEGNYYFPPDSINQEYFKKSNTETTCFWKGVANYYTIEVKGKENQDAAWYYPNPKPKAQNIKNYVAFWRGVEVKE